MNRRWPARMQVVSLALLVAACTTQAGVGPDGQPRSPAPGAPHAVGPLPDGVSFRQTMLTLKDGSPVRTSVLTVRQGARVEARGSHGSALVTADTVRTLAHREQAVAAVNGTFFDVDSARYSGDPLGLYISRGVLLSEAAGQRTALILPGQGKRPRITELGSSTHVTSSDGARAVVDGIDRVPGRIVGCGGVGGDRLADTGLRTGEPHPGRVCFDPDELIAFSPQWGAPTPSGDRDSTEAVLDANGTVTVVRSPAGGPVPRGGQTLVGIGSGVAWLRKHGAPGRTLTVSSRVTDPEGQLVETSGASVLGAGPALVRRGRTWTNDAANGMSPGAGRSRAPRTVVGVRGDGALLLVVFDGRRSGVSEGVSLTEAADILVSMGAEDAMNLDGGGSSTMVVQDRVCNSPSDAGTTDEDRQREVSNALVVVPRQNP